MMKRLTWFGMGVAAGALGSGAAKRKVRAVTDDLTPLRVARRATTSLGAQRQRLSEAVRDGRAAMRAKELELRARMDGRTSTLADELEGVDTVIVDGRPVHAGQVIVLRDVREQSAQGGTDRPRRAKRRA